jgi:hypothetical protein
MKKSIYLLIIIIAFLFGLLMGGDGASAAIPCTPTKDPKPVPTCMYGKLPAPCPSIQTGH